MWSVESGKKKLGKHYILTVADDVGLVTTKKISIGLTRKSASSGSFFSGGGGKHDSG